MDGSLGSLVGRDLELSSFDGLVAGVLSGRGGVVWVEGEPGIGKSALVGAMVGRASGAGCVTLVGRGDEAGQIFPLRLMSDCLHGVAAAGGSESGAAGSVLSSRLELFDPNAADPVWAAGERMLAVVDRLCADRPVVLVAEDLQWADEWSLGLWTRLARSVDQIPLLLVGTSRPLAEHAGLARAPVGGGGPRRCND
jgi:AAA ATPase domain